MGILQDAQRALEAMLDAGQLRRAHMATVSELLDCFSSLLAGKGCIDMERHGFTSTEECDALGEETWPMVAMTEELEENAASEDEVEEFVLPIGSGVKPRRLVNWALQMKMTLHGIAADSTINCNTRDSHSNTTVQLSQHALLCTPRKHPLVCGTSSFLHTVAGCVMRLAIDQGPYISLAWSPFRVPYFSVIVGPLCTVGSNESVPWMPMFMSNPPRE